MPCIVLSKELGQFPDENEVMKDQEREICHTLLPSKHRKLCGLTW
jgi:hypothetical protein